MKIRRKTNRCLNCYRSIDVMYNFCPNCGQENTNRNVNFRDLIREFFNNYLSFDSKFGRSIKPFFLSPGKLTAEFINGRRVNYANPIRLYLILSLFFFFILSQFNVTKNSNEGRGQITITPPAEAQKVIDSIASDNEKAREALKQVAEAGESVWPLGSSENFAMYLKYREDDSVTDAQLYDSLQTDSLSNFDKAATKQFIRVTRAKNKELTNYAIEQMPFMMFLMLPLFALLLKLLYIRRQQNYIIHLVHSLHIHSFKFLLIGLAILIAIFTETDLSVRFLAGAAILSVFYVYLSFKRVYAQGYIKTFIKLFLFYFSYMILLSFGLGLEVLLSAVFY